MEALRIINGQFMRGDEIVRPEIGNLEQIECLRKAAKKQEEDAKKIELFKGEGLEIDPDVDTTVSGCFQCICGDIVQYRDYDFTGEIDAKCERCGRRYEIYGNVKDVFMNGGTLTVQLEE